MNKFAIYTACIGGYDNILQPEVIDDRFDYYLFTDDVTKKQIGVWKVRHVDYTNLDKTRIARYVKTHPEELLPDYDATLWMDANIQIVSRYVYDRVVKLCAKGIEVASVCHPERDCIYDESWAVVNYRLEHDRIALIWCRKLWEEHYPLHNGLHETGVLYRKNSKYMQSVDATWWNCINQYSKRDQLSFNYSLWKYGVPTDIYILPQKEHAKISPHVKYVWHAPRAQRKYLQYKRFELARCRYRTHFQEKEKKEWNSIIPSHIPIGLYLTYETLLGMAFVLARKVKRNFCMMK